MITLQVKIDVELDNIDVEELIFHLTKTTHNAVYTNFGEDAVVRIIEIPNWQC